MPTYEYECDKCRGVFEIRQRITEPALTTHEGCGGAVRRLLSPAPFILKGDGWYVTDYPSESRKKAVEAEKGGKSGKSAEKGDKSSEATAKTDTKAESTSSSTSAGTSESAKPAASSTSSAGASSSSSSTST